MILTGDLIIHEDEKEFEDLKTIIKKRIGFNCNDYKQSHLKRRITIRMRVTRSSSYKEYAHILINSLKETQELRDALTVNVTEFFRNPETYQAFRTTVLPELIKAKEKEKRLKIWSAGCSIGVEPYSIAIMLHDFLGYSTRRYAISIIATDIDDESLKVAEKGDYKPQHLEKMDRDTMWKYFIVDDNKYTLIDEIKHMVTFKHHDMISGPRLYGFDVIFCRNVTIYFNQQLQEKLYLNFYDSLRTEGYFVMGKTETLVGQSSKLFSPVDVRERIYQKKM